MLTMGIDVGSRSSKWAALFALDRTTNEKADV